MAKSRTPRGKKRAGAPSRPDDTPADEHHTDKAQEKKPGKQNKEKNSSEAINPDVKEIIEHVIADASVASDDGDDDGDGVDGEARSDGEVGEQDSDDGGENDDDDDDDENAMETVAIADLPKHTIVEARNDVPAIEKKLTEISLFNNEAAANPLPFWESLSVQLPMKQPLSSKLALDDLEREKKFAELTAAAVHNGLDRLRGERVKFRRPSDFFAEMAKSDGQMGKVKAQILFNKERIEAAEKRRNNRDITKNKKKVRQEQIEKEQGKKRKTREEIEAYSRLRQQRLKQRAQGDEPIDDDEFPIDVLDIEQLDEGNKFQKQKDIASGKKKAWRPGKQDSPASKTGHENRGRGKNEKGNRGARPEDNDERVGGRNVRQGGVQKKRKGGPKKRLGKSRRVAAKGRG